MSKQTEAREDGHETAHLDEVPDGCGCAEVWERMSEHRGDTEDEPDAPRR